MSADLPDHASVVIVGGGVMGASAAFHLAEAGVSGVVLLERDQLASGSTSKSAGGVRAQFTDPLNIALGARSLAAFEQFHVRPAAPIDLKQVGYLFLHDNPESFAAAGEAVALQNSMGVASATLSPEEAMRRSPAIDPEGLVGATFHARDGYCTPEAVVQGYARAAREAGAIIRTGVEVLGIETSGGQIRQVRTAAGAIRTDTVICAAGVWSSEIAEWLGVDLPVSPKRRQILVTEPLGAAESHFPEGIPMTIDAASTLYFHREGPGLLLGMSFAGERPGFHEGFSNAWDEELAGAMQRRAPALLELGVAHRWAGYYEVTPDNNAVIGEATTVSRFIYATGFSGHGFLQGPAVGEILRDLYRGVEPPIDIRPLSAERFAGASRIREHHIV